MRSPGSEPGVDLPAGPGHAVVLGSAGEPWPVPGCRCAACRSGPAAATALRLGEITLSAGRLDTPDGSRELRPGERYQAAGVRMVALPGVGPRRPVVVGIGERTLLWSEGAGDLPEATLEAL